MKKTTLSFFLSLLTFNVFCQAPTFFAENYDSANFNYWSNGYDKTSIIQIEEYTHSTIRTTKLLPFDFYYYAPSLHSTPTFDFPDFIDISSNPIISVEILQPKTFEFWIELEAIDINNNKAKTERIKLNMSEKPEIYTLVFETNDSIDFTQIDKIQVVKYRKLTGLKYTESNVTDFYLSAISIGKEITSPTPYNYPVLKINYSNWDLSEPIFEGKKTISIQNNNLVLEHDSTSLPFTGTEYPFLNFRFFLEDTLNLRENPVIGIKFKSNQNISFGVNARDNFLMSNTERWSTNMQSGHDNNIGGFENRYTTDSSECFSILNFDLQIDCKYCLGMGNRELFHVDSITGLVFNVLSYDKTKPLRIEIEEITFGGIIPYDSLIYTSDTRISGGYSGFDTGSLNIEEEKIFDTYKNFTAQSYLSKNHYLGNYDSKIDSQIVASNTLQFQYYDMQDLPSLYRYFSSGEDKHDDNLGYLQENSKTYFIQEINNNSCNQKNMLVEELVFDFILGSEDKKGDLAKVHFSNHLQSNEMNIYSEDNYTLRIIGMDGNDILESAVLSGLNRQSISSIQNGYYIIQFENKDKLYSEKILIEK